jgi:hypothetical protein
MVEVSGRTKLFTSSPGSKRGKKGVEGPPIPFQGNDLKIYQPPHPPLQEPTTFQ